MKRHLSPASSQTAPIRKGRHGSHGFTLIDLLVGIVIGIMGLLAVTKVMVDFNQRRNSASSLMETQGNGALALYLVERDLNQAGYGMMDLTNCARIQYWYSNTASHLSPLPVLIEADGTSDRITVQYSYSDTGAPSTNLRASQADFTDAFSVVSVAGFSNLDLVVANNTATNVCTLGQIYGNPVTAAKPVDPATTLIRHDQDGNTANLSPYNPGASPPNSLLSPTPGDPWWADSTNTVTATTGALALQGGRLVNLGKPGTGFMNKTYRVLNNSLVADQFPSKGSYSPLADDVIYMKAQYGRDTDNDHAIDVWSDSSWAITSSNINEVLAVRVGIVVRSPLLEKDNITLQPDPITVLPDTGVGNAVTMALPDKHFRYRAYTAVVPLRNVIWGSTQ